MNKNTSSHATNLEELEFIFNKIFPKESYEKGLAFQPGPSDIIISPYAKCGTTWLQQIVHGLRTRGSMDFEEINAVTPWIEIAHSVGWDLDASQIAEPRVFKSHLSWHDVPKGGRYIVAFRHYHAAIESFYRFFEGFFFEPGSISIEELILWRWPRDNLDNHGYWYHLISWWEQRHNESVLLLCYEDMLTDPSGTVKKIAHFAEIELDDALFDIVLRQSSRDFMLAHKHKFDEKHTRKLGEKYAGIPPNSESSKVTQGNTNNPAHKLSSALKDELDDIWREQMQFRFGFNNYEELCQAVKEINSVTHK